MTPRLSREFAATTRQHWRLVLRAVGALLSGLTFNLLTPWPLKLIVDNVLKEHQFFGQPLIPVQQAEMIIGLAITAGLLIAARGFFNHRRHVHLTELTERVADSWRARLFEHVLHLRSAERERLGPSDDLRSRLNEDVDRLRDCYSEFFSTLLAEALTLVGVLGLLMWLDWRFAVLTLTLFSSLLFVYQKFPQKIGRRSAKARALEVERASFTSEVVASHIYVKAWGREVRERGNLERLALKSGQAQREKALWEGRFIFSIEMLTALVTAATLAYGAWRVQTGALTLGDLIVALQYLSFLYAPVGRLSAFLIVVEKGATSWARVSEVLRLTREKNWAGASVENRKGTGSTSIKFSKLGFRYPGQSALLKNITSGAQPDEVLAIVGPSGSGKSTIFKLLLGFVDARAGEVLINGQSVEEWDLKDLRRRIAYVDQEAKLFPSTIFENLTYGLSEVDQLKLRRVCRDLQVEDFILKLPLGYETPVREGGTNFSLGQRQRLSIARAVLSDRDVLLLDEPTSALDPQLERDLLQKLPKWLKGKTVILITHRPAPLQIATRVLDLGRPDRLAETQPNL